jgi:UDP-glucuronate 4-epimerase
MRAIDRVQGFEIINLGGSRTTTLGELIALLETRMNKRATIEGESDQPGDVMATWAEVSKGKRLLGYEPRLGIEEGVKKFVDWYRRPDMTGKPRESARGKTRRT